MAGGAQKQATFTTPVNAQPGQYYPNNTNLNGWPAGYGGYQSIPGGTWQTQYNSGNTYPGNPTPPPPPTPPPAPTPGNNTVPPGGFGPIPGLNPTQPTPPRLGGTPTAPTAPPAPGNYQTPISAGSVPVPGANKGVTPPNLGTPGPFTTPPPSLTPGPPGQLGNLQAIMDWYKTNPFYSNLINMNPAGKGVNQLGVPVYLYGQDATSAGQGPWSVGGAFLNGTQPPDSWLLPPPGGGPAYTQQAWDMYNQSGLEGKNLWDPANADAVNKMKQFLGLM